MDEETAMLARTSFKRRSLFYKVISSNVDKETAMLAIEILHQLAEHLFLVS
jgi:hypothetical protein